jgi:Luciferase-like monooxygenase
MLFGLSCELRNPAQWRRTTAAVYADVIEHLVAAEAIGFEAADFVEHHFVDDGYNPSSLLAAAAVASRTKRMRVATNGYTGLGDKAGYDAYLAEILALGKDSTQARVRGVYPGSLVVSEDPERTFARLEPYVTYWANSYAKWFEGTGTKVWSAINSAEELKATNLLNVMTPSEAVKMFNAMSASMTLETFSFSIAPPGFPVSDMFEYIELFAKQVIPLVNPPGACS